jgi:hypothetical protein
MPFLIFTFSCCILSRFVPHTFLKQIQRILVGVRSVGLGGHNPFELILSPKSFFSIIRWCPELMPDRAIPLNPISLYRDVLARSGTACYGLMCVNVNVVRYKIRFLSGCNFKWITFHLSSLKNSEYRTVKTMHMNVSHWILLLCYSFYYWWGGTKSLGTAATSVPLYKYYHVTNLYFLIASL